MWTNIKIQVRRWVALIFNKSEMLKDVVDTQVSEEHYKMIDKWKAIYAGYFKDWHDVRYNTINGDKTRTMHSLNMAKVASQELAKIIFTEKVGINISDKTFHDNIQETLKNNRFNKLFQSKLENMFALGGLVLKVHPKELPDGSYELSVTYIAPDCFIPTSWENGEVTEGAFLNISKKKDKSYCLFEFHTWAYRTVRGEDGEPIRKKVYVIKNELFEEDKYGTSKKVPLATLYEELEEKVMIENLTQPLFQYIRPNIANNFDIQSPLGISIFANACDTLYAIDTAFDSLIREFRLGKRKIIVPSQAIKAVVDPTTGTMMRYFDANDEVYEAFNFADPEKQKIMDNTVDLRVEEHIGAINALLNIYSMQVGLSPGSFSFDGQGVKTATEVVSENSKTYQTKQVNEELIEEGLRKFIHTIAEVAALYDIFTMPIENYDVEFAWDDTIVKDKYTDSDFYIKLKGAGLVTAKYALMQILDLTDEQATTMIKEITTENRTMNPEISDMYGDKLGGVDE